MDSLSDERRGCRWFPITRLDGVFGGRFADQKKGSSFGTTAAASRGVFYELPFRRGKSRNGFTCTSSSTRGQSGFADLPTSTREPLGRVLFPIALDMAG